ncbi:FAD-dependent monooxygenase [Nocardia zapadnayensis]|uniref:FAD-dependent monooxygenase n=1 Tax=Nocardia rhamnosiphila TaxID=426716 RepID=UPI0022478DBC|nr:FAD-dependent monooxygenase [Nocardia zapadnayensis]MCX0275153.1 FAD-dependent monooxygenase [Nocardia zapadnayensis]
MSVLVVGAGPTGMVAALVLAANGVPCRVLERHASPSGGSRALGLQARSMELLAELGLADDIERVAYPLSGASIMRGDAELSRLTWVPPQSRYPYTYVLPQPGLEDILRTRLHAVGVEIEYGAEVRTVVQDGERVGVQLADKRDLEARWLVGADGARSNVRGSLGIPFTGGATGETYYLADIVLESAMSFQDSAMWLGPAGPLMLMRLPGGDGLWRVFVDMSDRARREELLEPSLEELQVLLQERGAAGMRITQVQWTSIFRTRVCLADRYRRDRAFLAGDAAHIFPPFGGQGMNLGIQDAVNLAWRLARVESGASAELLDDYETERRPVAAATIRDVESRRRMYALRNPLARSLRDSVLRLGARFPGAARQASLQNSQLAIGYGGGPRRLLSQDPDIGDRAPDAALAEGTVHDLLGVDHFTLLDFRPGHRSEAKNEPAETIASTELLHVVPIDDRTDPAGEARDRYSMSRGGYVLIRPDGHVAYRGRDATEARRVLARFTEADRVK